MGLFKKLLNLANGKKEKSIKKENNKIDEEKINKAKSKPQIKPKPKKQAEEKTVIKDERAEKISFTLENEAKADDLVNLSEDEAHFREAQNIVELEELSRKKIIRKLSSLSYANIKLKKLVFHFREHRGSVSSVQGEQLFSQDDFLNKLKAALENKNIDFVKNVEVDIIFGSKQIDSYTPITDLVSVEVLTPKDINSHKKAKITALTGKTLESEYIIDSNKKIYFIGRGKTPQLPTARLIKNDIVFIEPKEDDDEQIQLNKYVSRSILFLRFNDEISQFEIGRTEYMFKNSHIVKINRLTGEGGQDEINLNNTKIKVPLKNDDQIIINNKINILFELIE